MIIIPTGSHMEYLPHNFFTTEAITSNPWAFDALIVLGFIFGIFILKDVGRFLIDLILSLVCTISVTYIVGRSIYQKVIHLETNCPTSKLLHILKLSCKFAVKNFTLFLLSVDNDVIFESEDFYWAGLTDFKTYNQINNLA